MRKPWWRRWWIYVVVGLAAAGVVYGPLIVYGLRQGYGQMRIVWKARPIEEFLHDPYYPDSLKQKLRLVQEVRQYAIDSLGLRDTPNYQTMYDQQGEELLWVVTACEPFALRAHLWKFPVVGAVPYKGFFSRMRAEEEKARLEKAGYDVSIRNPGGWSTLGWFRDPILSGMLKRREGDLANLIIHEMVHATIWVTHDAEFNENLATFLGDTAAYYFLKARYGPESAPYQRYVQENEDYRRLTLHMLRGARLLDSVYQAFTDAMPGEEKIIRKEQQIRAIVQALDTVRFHFPPRSARSVRAQLPNNTYFINFRTYQSRQDTLGHQFSQHFQGNLRAYIAHLKRQYAVE